MRIGGVCPLASNSLPTALGRSKSFHLSSLYSSSSLKTSSPRFRRAILSWSKLARSCIDREGNVYLLLLTELGGGELLCLLGTFDLVAHGIELVLLVITLASETGAGTLALNPVVT